MFIDSLPPWQQIPYFWPGRGTYLAPSPGVATQFANYDPQRVLIVVFCTSGQAAISTEQNDTINNRGIQLTPSSNPVVISHDVWGPIVNQEWFVNANGSIYYWLLSLSRWPQPTERPVPPPQAPWYQRWVNALQGRM